MNSRHHGAYQVTSSDFDIMRGGVQESREELGVGINLGRPATRGGGVSLPCDYEQTHTLASANAADTSVGKASRETQALSLVEHGKLLEAYPLQRRQDWSTPHGAQSACAALGSDPWGGGVSQQERCVANTLPVRSSRAAVAAAASRGSHFPGTQTVTNHNKHAPTCSRDGKKTKDEMSTLVASLTVLASGQPLPPPQEQHQERRQHEFQHLPGIPVAPPAPPLGHPSPGHVREYEFAIGAGANAPEEEGLVVPSPSRSAGGRYRTTAKVIASGTKSGTLSTLLTKIGKNNATPTRNSAMAKSYAKRRAPYRCRKCGQIKSNHLCPFKYGIATTKLTRLAGETGAGTSRPQAPTQTAAINDTLRAARRYLRASGAFLARRQSGRVDRNAQISQVAADGSCYGLSGDGAVGFGRGTGVSGEAQSYTPRERESGSAPGWSNALPRFVDTRPGLANDSAMSASLAGRPPMIAGGPSTTVNTTAPGGSGSGPLPAHQGTIFSNPRRCGVDGWLDTSAILQFVLTPPPFQPVQDMTPSQDVRKWRQEMAATTVATAAVTSRNLTLPPRMEALEGMLFGDVLEPSAAAGSAELRLDDATTAAGGGNGGNAIGATK